MGDKAPLPGADELERLGLYDPAAPDAEDRLELVRYAMERGATVAEIAAAVNLGELALDLNLRLRTEATVLDVVEGAGMDWTRAVRLLSATGFTVNPDQRVTAGEADTIRMLGVASDLLGEEAAVQLSRVAGNAMARVAEAIVAAFRVQFELPRRSAGARYSDVVKEYADVAQTLLPAFVSSLDALLRRQILAVAERVWSTDAEQSAVTLPRVVGFADLVGFTGVAASMSVRELTAVLAEFDERTANVVLRGNGQVVKTIGDEAMFVAEDAGDGCRVALDLVAEFGRDRLPAVRVGLAFGEVVSASGDLYGPDVNLAARLVGVAEPSTVVASERVRAECGGSFRFDALPPLTLKGFTEPVSAYRVTPRAGGGGPVRRVPPAVGPSSAESARLPST